MLGTGRIDELLAEIRALPVPDRLKLVEHVVRDIASESTASQPLNPGSIIGSFADVAGDLEDITEAAMVARGREPLRLPHG